MLVLIMMLVTACSSASDNSKHSSASNKGDRTTNTESAQNSDAAAPSSGSEPMPPPREEGRIDRDTKRAYSNTDIANIQAGQLTAGEWDDIAAWGRFTDLLNSREADNSMKAWGFGMLHRLEVIVSANGQNVSDAQVELLDNGQSVWTARTNREGRAYLFAGMFEDDNRVQQIKYEVKVSYENESKSAADIDMTKQDVLKIDMNKSKSSANDVDIMFVVDTTGSMQDELDYLGAELKDVISRAAKEHQNELSISLSANFYRDKYDDYVVKPFPFTSNVDKVIGQINDQEARGGGDYPEAVDQALRNAIHDHKWSKDARARLLFLVLDAPPHSDAQVIDEIHRLMEDAAAAGIRVIPIASSGVDVDTEYLLRFMAAATGGTYLFLTDDSGIGSDHLEPAVGEYEVKLLNDLLVEVINRYVN